jgi:Gas vesicle synthesis protein GvpL/GvpF
VTGELLAAHHDEFAAALQQLEGRVQFLVKSRYLEQAVLDEVTSQNTQAARLQDTIAGQHPDAARNARDARAELGEIINQAVTASRKRDTRALEQATEEICVASVVREPARELDAAHVAFLVDANWESELEQAIEDLACDWEGRIEVQLLGPMAAYDFVTTAAPDG